MERFVRRHQLTDTERAQACADGEQIRIETEAHQQAAARQRISALAAEDPGTCGTRTRPRS